VSNESFKRRLALLSALLAGAMVRERLAAERRLAGLRRRGAAGVSDAALAAEIEHLQQLLRRSAARRLRRQAALPQPVFDDRLPITARKDEIIAAVRRQPVVIVSGETGSGKSTQIPKFCLAAGRGAAGMIGHTQPRRIAVMSVARRVAEELGAQAGGMVGTKMRFEDRTPKDALIKIMTDGILLAETQGDRLLSTYDTLIVDEAHERSLNIDFLLGYLRTLLRRRRDLRLVVTSATIDTEKFAQAFGDAPVIEVSGRSYPVEVRYAPAGEAAGQDEPSHIELAVRAVRDIGREKAGGDILVFMPTEQDIRETCEQLPGACPPKTQILPLFARLSAAEQARVFKPSAHRRIIVATNVAETAITIPGIRYVVDTGLARVLRYSPRTRTTSLPVVPVARSSADQRAGRCGRVADGVCIRLYSEQDYLQRPHFTAPEILRANLAEVILRMLALNLGDVAGFPFIDPPDPKSVGDGFNLLFELGAILEGGRGQAEGGKEKGKDKDRGAAAGGKGAVRLTEIGRMMARVPLDPRVSRMLIEARKEGCVAAVAVVAAALSIQDPRERPAEKVAEADRIHAAFRHPSSDFLSFLLIWQRFQEIRQSAASRSQAKRFCRDHFLSYRRMCEWEDIHRQIGEILAEFGFPPAALRLPNSAFPLPPAEFAAIHRAILSGFLANIAVKKEKNIFRAARGREAMIFPGSALFNSAGAWIVAAEMVETSRLFARTVAGIDSAWLEQAGGRLCRSVFLDPRWDIEREEVVATEQVSLFGLLIVSGRNTAYGKINPAEAADIFIRRALVGGELKRPFAFMRHNQAAMARVQAYEERLRRRDLLVGEDELARFYRSRLGEICDRRALSAVIASKGGDGFLRMTEEDLLRQRPEPEELARYPERLPAGRGSFECRYRFDPGAEDDGVTLRVPAAAAAAVPPEALEWVVPGLLREKIEALVRGLPKAVRRRLAPLKDTIEVILAEMPRTGGPLLSALGGFLHRRFGVDIPASAWPVEDLPVHLRMRVALTAADGRELAASRDAGILRSRQAAGALPPEVRRQWEKSGLRTWDFGDLPGVVASPPVSSVPWAAYPALVDEPAGIELKLFTRRDQALSAHAQGVAALLSLHFSRELKFLKRSLALPRELHAAARGFGGAAGVMEAVMGRLCRELFAADIRTRKEFLEHAAACEGKIMPRGRELLTALIPVLQSHAEVRRDIAGLAAAGGPMAEFARALEDDLARLIPPNFVALYDAHRFPDLERYIRGIGLRARRAAVDLQKDRAKARAVHNYAARLDSLLKGLGTDATAEKRRALEDLFWLLQEYTVSVFAQELGTSGRVSPKRLEEKFGDVERMV
jgi:ATP-dependent helicase HrpA